MLRPSLLSTLVLTACAGTPTAPPASAVEEGATRGAVSTAGSDTLGGGTSAAATGDGTVNKYALLVGINEYGITPDIPDDQQWAALSGTDNDVAAMRSVLEPQGFEIVELHDGQATWEGITSTFESHLGQADADDVVVFYYSGHGQQVPDQEDDPDEVDGYDEALVPHDNLGTWNSSNHLRDDTMRTLIEFLETDNAVVIIDACNSGSATRGEVVVRGKGPAAPPAQNRGAEVDEGGGLLPVAKAGARGYVMLSAARSEEPAVEVKLPVGDSGTYEMQGAMTYHLVRELSAAGPDTTWRQVADRVRSRLKKMNLTQQPQVEGDVNKALFSGAWGAGEGVWRGSYRAGAVIVEAGGWQGLEKGDRLSVHAPGSADVLATAEVRVIDLDKATAKLEDGQSIPDDLGEGALDVRLLQPSMAMYVPRLDVSEAPKGVARDLAKAAEAQGIEVVTSRKDAGQLEPGDVIVREVDGTVQLVREGGEPVAIPTTCNETMAEAVPADTPELTDLLQQALELDRVRTRIEGMDNQVASSRLDVRLEVHRVEARWDESLEQVVVDADHGPLDAKDGYRRLSPRETFQLFIVNDSDRDVYVNLLELGVDGSISVRFPFAETGRDETLVPAGKTLPIEPLAADEHPGRVAWKLVATETYVDFWALEHRVECREDLATRGDRDEDSELSALFSDFATSTRSDRLGPTAGRSWGTDIYYADVVE